MLGGLHRANLNGVAVPSLYVHRAVHVPQLKRAARLQRIRLIELLSDRETRYDKSRGKNQSQKRSQAECTAHHNVLPPSRINYFQNRGPERNSCARRTRAATAANA